MAGTRQGTFATVAGLAAGAAAFLLARTAVEPARAWFVAGHNAVVWGLAVGLFAAVAGEVALQERGTSYGAVKWNGAVVLLGSLGLSGVYFLLPDAVPTAYAITLVGLVGGVLFGGWAAGVGWSIANAQGDASGGTENPARADD